MWVTMYPFYLNTMSHIVYVRIRKVILPLNLFPFLKTKTSFNFTPTITKQIPICLLYPVMTKLEFIKVFV